MKNLLLTSLLLLIGAPLFAQKKGGQKFVQAKINVDGSLDEWKDLVNTDEDSTWRFAIAKDKYNLYIAVEIKHSMLQIEAARNGILVNINTEGKKKDGIQLTFPVPDGETIRAMLKEEDLKPEQVRSELIERSRGYRVRSFPLIVDGLLSLDNNYGIKAVVKVDNQDRLIYESVIPIDQLKLRDLTKNIAVQVVINNRWAQMQKMLSSSRQQNNYYRMPQGGASIRNPIKAKTEMWVIDNLTTKE